MLKYHAAFSIDTSLDNELDGFYAIEDYTLRPCLVTEAHVLNECSNFFLEFDFSGWDEKDIVSTSFMPRKFALFKYNALEGARIAKEFVAWLTVATREWARLSYQSSGFVMAFGPYLCERVEDFDESKLDKHHVDRNAKRGEFFNVQRPSFSFDDLGKVGNLKLPSDFPLLTRKLFSLRRKEREKFLNACFSYQYALENWMPYPTVSLLSLVSAVESMMVDQYTSRFCEDANKRCSHKKDVMKKFRAFFEQSLQYPLPKELKKFLQGVYSKRSDFVHKALLGTGEAGGIQFGFKSEKADKLDSEKRYLEKLVNAALLEWLARL